VKVAYVLPTLQKPSGWRSHARAFIEAISSYVQPLLYVQQKDLAEAQKLFPGHLINAIPTTQAASFSSWQGWRKLAQCYLAISKFQNPSVDLVHSLEAYPTGLVGLWLARKANCPHVITTHGTYGVIWVEKKIDLQFYRATLKKTRLICPVSKGTADLLRQYFKAFLQEGQVVPILNGNDYYQKIARREAWERALPEIPTIISVGDVKERKGQHISLAAFARIKEMLPMARYWIVGRYNQNQYYKNLCQYISSRQLADVRFWGAISSSRLRECYQQASVFILTPQQIGLRFEGFGLVYLEAGAHGLPVVGTRSGGVPEAVQEGVTGYLLEPEDIEGIAQALYRLLTQPQLARQMGRANRLWAETLTWERNAREQYQLYTQVLEPA